MTTGYLSNGQCLDNLTSAGVEARYYSELPALIVDGGVEAVYVPTFSYPALGNGNLRASGYLLSGGTSKLVAGQWHRDFQACTVEDWHLPMPDFGPADGALVAAAAAGAVLLFWCWRWVSSVVSLSSDPV